MKRFWYAPSTIVAVFGILAVLSNAASTPNPFVSAERLIQFLHESINLYHENTIQRQIATDPQEQLLLYENSQLATESVRLSFEFARAQLDAVSAESLAAPSSGGRFCFDQSHCEQSS
jgi:hypothetical protein